MAVAALLVTEADSLEFDVRALQLHATVSEFPLADRAYAQGRARAAGVHAQCQLALQGASDSVGAEHPQTARIARECGDLAISVGAYDEARKLYERAAAIYRKHFGEAYAATVLASEALQQIAPMPSK